MEPAGPGVSAGRAGGVVGGADASRRWISEYRPDPSGPDGSPSGNGASTARGPRRLTTSTALTAVQLILCAAAVTVDDGSGDGLNSAECEIVFVEFLGDLVKLHLTVGEERLLAKVPGERYASLRGREGEPIRISWKEEDVQLLRT